MYTSDTDTTKNNMLKTAFIYLLISLFCILFGAVYEIFSHEVYSYFMIYAFAFPLVGGTLPFFLFGFFCIKNLPTALPRNLYHSGIATLTVGSIVRGILEIYGTTNQLSDYYWIVGITLIFAGILFYVLSYCNKN